MTPPPPPSSQPGPDNGPSAVDRLNALLNQIRKRHGDAVAEMAASATICSANAPATDKGETAEASGNRRDGTPSTHSAAASGSNGWALLEPDQPVLAEFVRSFLIWEAGTAKAASAIKRIEQSLVDFNDLRVCMHDEFIRLLGKGTPKVEERAMRIRAALNDIYLREHGMTLEHLPGLGKREAREYLESVEGVPRFVAARTLLLALSGHAAPVDGRIHRVLSGSKVIEPGSGPDDSASFLEKKIRAGELLEAYLLLQTHADDPARDEPESSPSPSSNGSATRGKTKNAKPKPPGTKK